MALWDGVINVRLAKEGFALWGITSWVCLKIRNEQRLAVFREKLRVDV
jgi:hypothetical protein